MKTVYKTLLLSLLLIACKTSYDKETIPPKKANILEHTKWKASGADIDSTLDFHTSKDVVEYITLHGKEIKGRQGTYKVKNKRVEIKWSKLPTDRSSGVIIGKEMRLDEKGKLGVKTTKYYKISEY